MARLSGEGIHMKPMKTCQNVGLLIVGLAMPMSARAAGAGLPQLDINTWPSQLFWLVVLFGAGYLVMAKIVTPRIGAVLEERRQTVNGDLEKARNASAEAAKIRADYESDLENARSEARAEVEAEGPARHVPPHRLGPRGAGIKEVERFGGNETKAALEMAGHALTGDECEQNFQVNYLSHAKLTRLLSGALGADSIGTHMLLLASSGREHAEASAEILSFGGLARHAKLRRSVYEPTAPRALCSQLQADLATIEMPTDETRTEMLDQMTPSPAQLEKLAQASNTLHSKLAAAETLLKGCRSSFDAKLQQLSVVREIGYRCSIQ